MSKVTNQIKNNRQKSKKSIIKKFAKLGYSFSKLAKAYKAANHSLDKLITTLQNYYTVVVKINATN